MSDERASEEPPEQPEPELDEAEAGAFTAGDFHSVIHKLILNAVFESLETAKFGWDSIVPFLETAREMARADFEEAKVRLHTVQAEGESWVDADEAFLGISVADRDDGAEWLAETWWLSEIATADGDPEKVRAIVRALERSIGKLNAWLAQKEGGAGAPPSA